MNFLYLALALAIIFVITAIHAHLFADNQPITTAFHTVWLLIYCGVACVFIWLNYKFDFSWWFVVAIIDQRIFAYNQILNWIRHEKMFYIHGTEANGTGSGTDRLLEKIGILYPIGWALCAGLYIFSIYKLWNL